MSKRDKKGRVAPRGANSNPAFGAPTVRRYVLHGGTVMVKDPQTGVTRKDTKAVLGGDIGAFIKARTLARRRIRDWRPTVNEYKSLLHGRELGALGQRSTERLEAIESLVHIACTKLESHDG